MAAQVNLGGVAVVTGAGSGIGRATALKLAALGAIVHAADISAEAAEAVADEIGARGHAHEVDVSQADHVAALADSVFAEHGRVDVLHNNAGIGHGGAVEETPLEDWRRVVEVNLMGVIHGVHAFVPRMLEQGGRSHIVNTASGLGLVPAIEQAPYGTTKWGVVGLSVTLDAELRGRGIGVSALCPGIISTPIVRSAIISGELADSRQGVIDFYDKRGVSPEVVAEAAITAIRRRRPIQPVPNSHIYPLWLPQRISARLGGRVAQLGNRLLRREVG